MNIAFHNGVSGLIGYQQDLDVLAHNMANVNTNGFKESSSVFEDLLYTEMDTNAEDKHPTGHGMRIRNLNLSMEQGSPRQTNSPLDFAIMGEGFFAVERNGRVEYTRNGSLRIGMEGNDGYLVASDGGYMLDSKGQRIKLDRDKETNLFATDNIVDKLGVYLFSNPYGLEQTTQSSFVQTAISGEPYIYAGNVNKRGEDGQNKSPYTVLQMAVETSNVHLADQMVGMIVTQRAYQMNAKMVQTADQLEEIVNNLR
ncbi:MAG: flagellar hook-basal body protein [Oscillospiraceae bacterium]|jgi:flagellar basal-body rod protein FlgG|nr:flagellar hook-basal body protein [Oscillospiraceae bacterium]